MKDFIISTDSTADLPQSYLKENNIALHPLYYIVGGKEYGFGISELSPKDFYESMRNGKMPTTSSSNPEYITNLMKKQIGRGYDILHISFSSGLSCSYNNAAVCARNVMEEVPNANILVVDSLCATVGQGLIVHRAVQLKKQGKTMEEIAEWIKENRQHIVHQFIVDDLFHLVRGGRLSKSTAFFGTALRIQPLLYLDHKGRISNIGKVRGRKKALNTLADNIEEKIKGFELDTVFISHGDCIEDAIYLADRIKNKYGIENIMVNDICPTIGAHTGLGTVVVSYFGNER